LSVNQGIAMTRYGKAASKSLKSALHREKKARSVPARAASHQPKQAIAIGLSEARKKGAKVPRKRF
jgi:hypothetical protein